jgi:hypothetical protein
LALALYCIYDGIVKWNNPEKPWISFFFAAIALFTFFFRRRFAAKMNARQQSKTQD